MVGYYTTPIIKKKIKSTFDLTDDDMNPMGGGTITLQNNSDGKGDFIAKWEHPSLSKPTSQLDSEQEKYVYLGREGQFELEIDFSILRVLVIPLLAVFRCKRNNNDI